MRPYGYEPNKLDVREPEAEVIRGMATRVLEGESLRSLTTELNESGHVTPAGNAWKPNVLRRVLISDRMIGRTDDGEPAPWGPILEPELHERLVETLTAPERKTNAGPPATRVYLLTGGIALCGLCQTPLVARPDNNGRRGYVCPSGAGHNGCGKIRVNAEAVEKDVAERTLARLLRADAQEKVGQAVARVKRKGAKVPDNIAAAELRLKELGENYAQGFVEAKTLRAATKRIQADIKKYRKQARMAEALDNIAVGEAADLARWWEGASLSQQRALLDAMIDRVLVGPAPVRGSKRFDPSRVKVLWSRG